MGEKEERERDIQNFENEGGIVYPSWAELEELKKSMDLDWAKFKKLKESLDMEPYVPPWACDHWGQHEHDWLDCCDCQTNYEVYLEEQEQQPGGIEAYKPGEPWKPCCDKEDRNMNGGCNSCGDPSF